MPRTLGDTRADSASTTTTTGLTDTERAALRAASEYVGTVGTELETEVRVNHITGPFPSNYGDGERYLYLLGDGSRNAIRVWGPRSWKGPGGLKVTPEKGDRYRVRATVAKQENFKGEKQTTLKSPVILNSID